MRSSRAAVVSIVAVFSFAAVLSAQAGTRTHYFELINRAHDRLVALAIAPAGSDRFEPRPLGEAIDGGGDSATVEWAGEQCVYDLRFTFGNGRAVIYSDIDVCRNRSLRIQPLRLGRAAADGVAVDAAPAAPDSAPTPKTQAKRPDAGQRNRYVLAQHRLAARRGAALSRWAVAVRASLANHMAPG
jgi:hypothetical protein